MEKEQPKRGSFEAFLRAYSNGWLRLITGPLATVLFLAVAAFVSGWTRAFFALVAAACFVIASFQVWRDDQAKIFTLQTELQGLQVRPYDQAQRQLVRAKLAQLNSDQRDVLRYLVRFGRRSQLRIVEESGMIEASFAPIFMEIIKSGVLTSILIGRSPYWVVSPQFEEILKDELFPREEESPRRLFLNAIPK